MAKYKTQATTTATAGSPRGSSRAVRTKLLARRLELGRHLEFADGTVREERDAEGADEAYRAAVQLERETSFQLDGALRETLWEIDHALARMAEGAHGICEDCGEPIPEARLAAIPWVSLCVACQQQREHE